MDFGIRGKRALVCAASKGMGRAVAMALAQEGVALFLCARNADTLNRAAEAIRQQSNQPVHALPCDLSNPASREQLIQAVLDVFPTVDILIHNVGGPKPSVVTETALADWEHGFQQNFMSIVHLNQAFLPGMKQQRWGRIITITGLAVMEPIPNLAVSNAVRAAVTGMSKTLSDEVAPYDITVNCVAPGVIQTDRTEERIQAEIARRGGTREDYLAEYSQSIPMGRLGTPDEFAAAVVFLCSQPASYITGSTLCVDGGKRRSTY